MMLRPGHTRAVIALGLGLILLGCAKPKPSPGPGAAAPTGSPAPPPASAGSAAPGTPGPSPQTPPATGLLPPPPTTALPPAEASATGPAAGVDRSRPDVVAKAYAAGLFTVDWTKPLPTTQKLAATTPWAAAAVTAKLAHGQNYQPGPTDPRVAASQVDTVDRVDLADADPVPGANSYLATVQVTTRTATATTTGEEFLLVQVARGADGWSVTATQLVS